MNVDFGREVDKMAQRLIVGANPPPMTLTSHLAKMAGFKSGDNFDPADVDCQIEMVQHLVDFCSEILNGSTFEVPHWGEYIMIPHDSPHYRLMAEIRFKEIWMWTNESIYSYDDRGGFPAMVSHHANELVESMSKENAKAFGAAVANAVKARIKQRY